MPEGVEYTGALSDVPIHPFLLWRTRCAQEREGQVCFQSPLSVPEPTSTCESGVVASLSALAAGSDTDGDRGFISSPTPGKPFEDPRPCGEHS